MAMPRGLAAFLRQLERVPGELAAMNGWRRLAAAFFAGVLCVLALPPVHFLPVLFMAFPVLVWLLDGTGEPVPGRRGPALRRAAMTGWAFGFGYFLLGLHWIGYAFMVEAEKFAVFMPFAVTLLPAGLAFFTAGAAALARLFWPSGYRRVLVLAVSWTVFEWLRGHVLTGFPWNLVGESFTASAALMQLAALVGVYGVSFVALLIVAAPAAFDPRGTNGASAREAGFASLAALAALALIWAGGALRLADASPRMADGIRIRIVQPNIPQTEKWRPERRIAVLGDFLRMSAAPGPENPEGLGPRSIVIWPESALAILLAREPYVLEAISRTLPEGAMLITGSVRGEPAPGGPPDRLQRFYNSIYAVDSGGRIIATYDKFHLVPFGEYLPMREWLSRIGLKKLVKLQGSFDTGPGPVTLALPGAPPVSPLVCYEIIFPDEVVASGARPGWIVNVTNDAWFGNSIGPHQHLSQAVLRAVEQGLPVVRAANTGISAVIDPYGRILARQGLNTAGVIDAGLPAALPLTPYARFGDLGLALLLLLGMAGAFRGGRR